MRIIGLVGKAGVGKDTIAGMLREDFGVQRVALADPVKDAAWALNPYVGRPAGVRLREVLGYMHRTEEESISAAVNHPGSSEWWDHAKRHPEVRRILQTIGTEVGREILGEDVWIQLAEEQISAHAWDSPGVVVTDVRFPNEVEWVQGLEGLWTGEIWQVIRPDQTLTGILARHESEALASGRELVRGARVILNEGTLEELRESVTVAWNDGIDAPDDAEM